ncbi:DUF86 domain-containing protein [Lentibacillus sp. Marseille-P4043]|uniref:DUF86 domain-containing protein n=1 Tax=Lentibacillus sp. Marseille-P4043 TaxID=2040293 RepID=UPI000D0B140C|nr:DUF86 domain-containing protein [Lentibacillus sp. Marseille-P4043]
MYFVDRSKIEQTLTYMESLLEEVKHHSFASFMEKLGLERIAHMIIESMLDVGNMMIDGFIMRDPGSFDDIIDILIDEKVIPKEDEASYKEMIQLRKMVVKEYTTIDHEQLSNTILDNVPVLEQFGPHVRHYLNNELGVANAFSNE